MTKESNEEPYIFYFDTLCMIAYLAGDDKKFDDVIMHVDEEMRLLEEMDDIEIVLIEHVFIDLGYGEFGKEANITREVEDNQMKVCNNCQDNRNPLLEEEYSTTEQYRDLMQHMEESMMILTTIGIQESCNFKPNS
jgi:hypothetical protein